MASWLIVKRKDKVFTHVGIYIGQGMVMHFASKTNNMFAHDQAVRFNTIADFSLGRNIKFVPYKNTKTIYSKELAINLGISYWGKNQKYHILYNSCFTFIIWCISKENKFDLFKIGYYLNKLKIFPLTILF